ncbi:hypothetical protein TEA_024659 [Camellia sinensis var. sinensis]|uniref:Uncharacterized protein n=1 Tax=Camellia sinensis var. sinensis TaxID=542762 RepID=A0A4S4CYL9_CAMSN|nr:hypothetical protein TEA_024659 [Camellia sinensis var. sinensis]
MEEVHQHEGFFNGNDKTQAQATFIGAIQGFQGTQILATLLPNPNGFSNVENDVQLIGNGIHQTQMDFQILEMVSTGVFPNLNGFLNAQEVISEDIALEDDVPEEVTSEDIAPKDGCSRESHFQGYCFRNRIFVMKKQRRSVVVIEEGRLIYKPTQ